MRDNLLSELREARLRARSLPIWERRQLVRRIFDQLAELRDASLSIHGLRTNQHFLRLIRSGDNTVSDLPKLSDAEFVQVLCEFEMLLIALTAIIRTDHGALVVN